jgi:DNA repair photolyase
MIIKEVQCKSALSKSNLPGLDYSLNPYRGCQHACAYCYVPNVLRIKRSEWGGFVDVKTNIPNVLSKELRTKKPGIVALSTVTDPYQPVEKRYKLTRFCLEQLLIRDFPVHIQTNSDLITRDIDLISKFSDVEVMFSIATLDDSERKLMEPYSSSIKNRFSAIKELNNAGIKITVFFGPVYPTINDENLTDLIDKFEELGVAEIMVDRFNLKPGIKENIVSAMSTNPFFLEKFSKDLEESYNKTRCKIVELSKKRKIRVVDAF